MSLVLDSSATPAWIYGEEMTDAVRAAFNQVADARAVVPALWRLEVAQRRKLLLVTLDQELRAAAQASGTRLLGA
ncbi:MAG: hypothetical protein ACJ8AW_36995 [Rhodopila sp.]